MALVVGLLTLYSMIKIWAEVFWKAQPEGVEDEIRDVSWPMIWMWVPVIMLALMTVAIGLYGEPIYQMAAMSAEQLLDPSQYIEAVLGEARQ